MQQMNLFWYMSWKWHPRIWPYLSIDDGSHPVALAGPRHWQHGPEEDGDGKDQGGAGGRHHVVDDDDQVAHHLRVGHQHVVEGVAELEDQGLPLVEYIWLLQLLIIKHSGQTHTERERWIDLVFDYFPDSEKLQKLK